MNKFSKLFLAMAASTMMLSSCSSEEPVNGPQASEGGVYATLTLSLPQGSKSATQEPGDEPAASDNGYEAGNDSENNVGSVLVVIAEKVDNSNYTYIASNLADAHTASSSTSAKPVYNVQFETRDLYEKAGATVYVFAYCNPSSDLVEAAKNKFTDNAGFINRTGNVATSPVALANGFFMSNALTTTCVLPSQDDMNNYYNTPTNPFNLGVVKVERAAARFDFKETTIGNYDANCYPIFNHSNSDIDEDGNVDAGDPVAFVQLDGKALLNEAVNYYYLPRVSADGTDAGAYICGQETPSNYVVSPGFAQKTATNLDLSWLKENFNFNGLPASGAATGIIFDGEGSNLNYEGIGQNLGEDNPDETWTGTEGDYYIWKYTTENTIPALTLNGTANYQRVGVTTGIVFRGYLQAADATSDLGKVITGGTQIIYAYNGVLYGNLDMLKKAVVANPVSTLAETFKEQFSVADVTDAQEMAAITTDLTSTVAGGLTIYRPSAGKYYMYYTYLNRHNDNGNNTVMYPMEFSVVRNNVYKLAVQNILEFGHPADPGDDPDPENPEDPDETPKTYFRVQVKVLPWVVRVNNIIL